MSKYKGLRSTDAEIILDLERGKAIFDYSLNKFALSGNSNTSCTLHKEIRKENFFVCMFKFYLSFVYLIIPVGLVGAIAEIYPQYQYTHQKILKEAYYNTSGMIEESIIGKQDTNIIKFHINNNIWFDYSLDGDYNTNIKKVSLLRNFVKKITLGTIKHKQDGWNVVFEFKEPPEYGNVVLRYIA